MSQPPDNRNPWAKYHPGATRPPLPAVPPAKPLPPKPPMAPPARPPVAAGGDPGLTRPPLPLDLTRAPRPAGPKPARAAPAPDLTRPPFPRPTASGAKPSLPPRSAAGPSTSPVPPATSPAPVSDELDAAVAAMKASLPGETGNPFLSAELREAAERERRREARVRLARGGVGLLVGMVLIHIFMTRVIWRFPEPELLDRHVARIMEAVTPLASTARQPLRAGRAKAVLVERVDANHLRYLAEVTLLLAEPLHVPAHTNGTDEYRRNQESLQSARAEELRLRLFPEGEGPTVPELPLLLQVSHRVDEPVVVRVPFEVERSAWSWRPQPPRLDLRSIDRSLTGDVLSRFAGSPHLVYGPATMDEVRSLTRAARDYIVRVQQAIQKVASAGAVEEPVPPEAQEPAVPPKPPAGR